MCDSTSRNRFDAGTGSRPLSQDTCIFCRIAVGEAEASIVRETPTTLTFLDIKPLFPGHCLVVPREHHVTMQDVAAPLLAEVFAEARLATIAVEAALGAKGSFVAVNNKVSQSVAHLHVHVVPRTKGDGLKGFFWPRNNYRDAAHIEETRALLSAVLQDLAKR